MSFIAGHIAGFPVNFLNSLAQVRKKMKYGFPLTVKKLEYLNIAQLIQISDFLTSLSVFIDCFNFASLLSSLTLSSLPPSSPYLPQP